MSLTSASLRVLVALACGLSTAAPAADAQQPAKVPRIGFLGNSPPSLAPRSIEGFLQGLRELGYVDGQNIAIEYRFAEGHYERFPELAAELVRLNVDVIVAAVTPAMEAAQGATRRSPLSW